MSRLSTKMTIKWASIIERIVVNGVINYKAILTDKQYDTLVAWMVGNLTQREVGHTLGVCQTTIHKTLYGNLDYSRQGTPRYGGIFRKIEKFESGEYIAGCRGFLRRIR